MSIKKKEKVEIISAYALTDENIKEVTDILQKKLGNDVSISTHVNKDLIGGLKIKTKNKVWDLSVKAKIEKLAFQINK
jgi:F-type H+-transporting ATPase subunit delta